MSFSCSVPAGAGSARFPTDLVTSQAHAGYTGTWTLDPNGRLREATLAGTAKINHYDDPSDSPAWIDEGFADGSLTRYVAGLDGGTRTTATNPAGGTPDGATTDLAATILMGVRLYTPTTGRFLTTDPVEGASETDYSYPTDPINKMDLDGRVPGWFSATGRFISKHKVANIHPGCGAGSLAA